LLLYGGGVAACRCGQYNTLTRLLASGSVTDHFEGKKPLLMAVNPARIVSNELSESAFGQVFGGRGFYRVSNRLSQVLRDPFRSLLAQDADYDDAFDRFEYLLAFVYADIAYGPRSLDNGIVPAWVPVGCVRSGKQEVFEEMTAEASVAGENWPPLKAGLFWGEIARFTKALRVLQDVYGRHERGMWT
jgi:hypothetical protein